MFLFVTHKHTHSLNFTPFSAFSFEQPCNFECHPAIKVLGNDSINVNYRMCVNFFVRISTYSNDKQKNKKIDSFRGYIFVSKERARKKNKLPKIGPYVQFNRPISVYIYMQIPPSNCLETFIRFMICLNEKWHI